MRVSAPGFQEDFDDEADLKIVKPNTARSENIGPWIESNLNQTARKQKVAKNVSDIENRKSMDFLATLQKGTEQKRRNYRNVLPKPEFVEKSVLQHESFENILFAGNIENEMKAKFRKYSLFQSEENESPESKKVLNTTIYICESNSKIKSKKLVGSDRNISFGYENNLKEEESPERSKASKNLQRILKMKEKLRVKNNSMSKQIKEKYSFPGNEISNYDRKPMKMFASISNEFQKATLESDSSTIPDKTFARNIRVKGTRSSSLKNSKPLSNLTCSIQSFSSEMPELNLFGASKTKLFSRM